MQGQLDLNQLVGKLVKIIFRETPDAPIEIRKGKLIGYDGSFLQIQSFENIHLINRRYIIALKTFGGGSDG